MSKELVFLFEHYKEYERHTRGEDRRLLPWIPRVYDLMSCYDYFGSKLLRTSNDLAIAFDILRSGLEVPERRIIILQHKFHQEVLGCVPHYTHLRTPTESERYSPF